MKNRPLRGADIIGVQEELKADQLRNHMCSFSNNHNYLGGTLIIDSISRREKNEWETVTQLLEDSLI